MAIKELLIAHVRENCPDVDCIVGLESRGFLFSLLIAAELGLSCVAIRKKGKLPGECYQVDYVLEYGTVDIIFDITFEPRFSILFTNFRMFSKCKSPV